MGRVQTWLSFQTGAGRIERRPVARDICSGPDELALQRLSRIMSASWGPRHSEQDEVQRRAEATASASWASTVPWRLMEQTEKRQERLTD
jgi:hypothetical protein